jgi:8-oxo-dGTP pyrophosphatase MutT (NUDIX family)
MDANGFHRIDLLPPYTLGQRIMLPLPSFGPALASSVRAHLAAHERLAVPLDGRRHAAVAVTLVADDEEAACFLLTRRAPRLSSHAGQWALPGGRVEAGESAVEGALRELAEEVGLIAAPSAVLGCLDDYPTRSGYVITPVVVWAGENAILAPDPSEVASVHRVPLSVLEHPDVPHLRQIPESDRPVISIAMIGHHVHAPTAAIVYQLREVALHGRATRVDHFEQPVFAWR